MNRRSFLNLAALAIAGKAAERVFPFRVYSIPKEIVVAPPPRLPVELFDYVDSLKSSMEMLTGVPPSLYGIPYYFPPGCLESVGPFMGISRTEFIPFTNLRKDVNAAEAAKTMAKVLACPHTYHRAESL